VTYTPTGIEVARVNGLDAGGRFDYSIKRFAASMRVWSLRSDDGWVSAVTDDGAEVIPVWPHSRFAELAATGVWRDAVPAEIALDEFRRRWVPGMIRDGRDIAILPTTTDQGVVIAPERFELAIARALEQYDV
jgi:hypothetical protein